MSDPIRDIDGVVTSTEDWLADLATEGRKLEVPSGHTALVRNPGLDHLTRAGIIPNGLMPIVQEAVSKGRVPNIQAAIEEDPQRLNDMMQLVDNVVVHCVIEPQVWPDPVDSAGNYAPHMRESGKLYVGMVDTADKWFIFQWVNGGTHDLESFREEYSSALAGVSKGERAGGSAKRTARTTATKRTNTGATKRPAKASRSAKRR